MAGTALFLHSGPSQEALDAAYQAGREAFKSGVGHHDGPYESGGLSIKWACGWMDQQDETNRSRTIVIGPE